MCRIYVDHFLTESLTINSMENELQLVRVRNPISIQTLRRLAERVANEANERHKDHFNGHPVYKVRSDTSAGIFDANSEFCVAMSEALPAAYLYVRVRYSENRIDRRFVTKASATA